MQGALCSCQCMQIGWFGSLASCCAVPCCAVPCRAVPCRAVLCPVQVGSCETSPNQLLLAWTEDTVGGEKYTLHVKVGRLPDCQADTVCIVAVVFWFRAGLGNSSCCRNRCLLQHYFAHLNNVPSCSAA
jgi:hypothetical protein